MKFLQIKDGFSLRKGDIEGVEKVDASRCRVYTRFNTHEINFPYETVLRLLEMDGIEEKISDKGHKNPLNPFGSGG